MKNNIIIIGFIIVILGVVLFSTGIAGHLIPQEQSVTIRPISNQKSNSFAISLLDHMPRDKNFMISPVSIRLALAMTANGAEGQTQDEMLKTLGIEDLGVFNTEVLDMMKRYQRVKGVDIKIANSIWLNRDELNTQFHPNFQKTIEQFYSGIAQDVTNADAVKKINSWIKSKTEGCIEDTIDGSDFVAALINAIYFKGEFAKAFDEKNTEPDIFTDIDGKKATIEFMSKEDDLPFYEDETLKMVEIPYKGGEITLDIILPKTKLNQQMLDVAFSKVTMQSVLVSMPKFKMKFKEEFIPILREMGISRAFEPHAEFGKMFEKSSPVFIRHVIHDTYIEVNEKGTKAAAVTVVSADTSVPEYKDFTVNSPFIFAIRDVKNGEILFIGEYLKADQ